MKQEGSNCKERDKVRGRDMIFGYSSIHTFQSMNEVFGSMNLEISPAPLSGFLVATRTVNVYL